MRGLAPLLVAATAAAAAASAAEPAGDRVVAALNQNIISISSGFDGSEIFVYGAIARERPSEGEVGVVVKIIGPPLDLVIRRKDRVAGVWTNAASIEVEDAPSYYALAATGALAETILPEDDRRYEVSLAQGVGFVAARPDLEGRPDYLQALARLQRQAGRYVYRPGGVELIEGVLFRASFELPAEIEEGEYIARVLLTRDRAVVDHFETTIDVRKVGVERALNDLAEERPLLYGVAAVAVALAAGVMAAEFFRYLRS